MAVKQGDNVEEGTWLITVEVTNMPSLTMRVRPTTKTSKLVKVNTPFFLPLLSLPLPSLCTT